jgi:hypothetical protein
MKHIILFLQVICLTLPLYGGFRAKQIKPKKPEQFQTRTTVAGVTFAADLLLKGKDQKDYFYKELTPSNIIAIRLAVFNNGGADVRLPLEQLRLIGPDNAEIPPVSAEAAAQAILKGLVIAPGGPKKEDSVIATPTQRTRDPRDDTRDPRNEPNLDPNRPNYDPSDPRIGQGPVPTGPYGNDPYGRTLGHPGIDVAVNPGGSGDLSEIEKQLVEKDFQDKAHAPEAILNSMSRDRFLYFSIEAKPLAPGRYILLLPKSPGIPEDVSLKF